MWELGSGFQNQVFLERAEPAISTLQNQWFWQRRQGGFWKSQRVNEMVRPRVGFGSAVLHQEDHPMQIASIGTDLGKSTFHPVALGERNKVLVRKKLLQS
jgi:hypothetical protein